MRVLKWCEAHKEPVWTYPDGTWACIRQLIEDAGDKATCKIVDHIPKEAVT